MNESGFSIDGSDRCGYIVYREEERSIKIYWELSGLPDHDICLSPVNLKEWDNPKGVKIDKEHQLNILRDLRQWLKSKNIRSTIDLPSEIQTSDRRCAWGQCDQQRIKGSAYCPYHYDFNLLRELKK